MRQPRFSPHFSATVVLLIINIAAFLLQNIAEPHWRGIYNYLSLSVDGLKHGFVWQLLSFQLLHNGFWHLFWNCFAIWMFGRAVEDALGKKNFYILYFSSGVVGGLFQVLAGLIAPRFFEGLVVGASAGAFGLTTAFALLFPDSLLLLFFIIPMRAKYLLPLSAVLAVAGMASATGQVPGGQFLGPHVAHAAHLGGMVAGFVFVRYAAHWNFQWPSFRRRSSRGQPRRLVKVHAHKGSGWSKVLAKEELTPEEFLSREVDPILDKISAQGIQSLTEQERKILEAARKKMRR
jgi:membrane associated rhomboid family serine protease